MATYFVSSTGSNTAPYDTWATAATSLQTALTAASSGSDVIVIQYNGVPSGDAELAADTTYTASANVTIISGTNGGGTTWAYQPMGFDAWIGNSTANRAITWAGAFVVRRIGITCRVSGATTDNITVAASDGSVSIDENPTFWLSNTSATSRVMVGLVSANNNVRAYMRNPTFRFGHVSQGINLLSGHLTIEGGSVSSLGSAPTALFAAGGYERCGGATVTGMDLSHCTTNLVGDMTAGTNQYEFVQCKLGTTTPLAAQTNPNQSGAEVTIRDCSIGDTHYAFGLYNPLGSVEVDTGIYANDGASYDGTNRCSWKITTTANASPANPYITPWMSRYHSAVAAITPSMEILRDGSATAFTDTEVWGEWSAKITSGSTQSTIYSDRAAWGAASANQAAGVGLAGWTGESATAWSGRIQSPSFTPAEIGDLRQRVCVGAPSATVYVDPTFRGV